MDCRKAIYSNEYYDFMIEYSDNTLDLSKSVCMQELNNRYGVGYWDRRLGPDLSIRDYTYTAIPKLFALSDVLALEQADILLIQNQPTLSLKGQGVLLGFIDTGIDYQNQVFRNTDGSSRIAAIWDQTIEEGTAPEGFLYGAEFLKNDIDEALRSDDPLGMVPSTDRNGHGTYVASLAAGGENLENQFLGAAPFSTIAVVKLKEAKQWLREYFFVPQQVPAFQENDIMAGIAYLDRLAYERNMPLVLCLALGSNMGSHGGTGPLDYSLEELVGRRRRMAVVSVGNEGNGRQHFRGEIVEEEPQTVEINVEANVAGFTVELWSIVPETFSVEIQSPTGEVLPRLSPQAVFREYTFLFEGTTVTVEKNITFSDHNSQLIFLRFVNPSPGIWIVRVFGQDILQGGYHMWLPMKEMLSGEVYFIRSNPNTTITVPSDTPSVLSVGGYNGDNNGIFLDSGRGFTSVGVIKPELAAPAVEVKGASLNDRFSVRSGNSASTAITAGAVALLFEWALVEGNYLGLTSQDVKNIMIRGASRDVNRSYPNREWGYGKLNLYEAFNVLREK